LDILLKDSLIDAGRRVSASKLLDNQKRKPLQLSSFTERILPDNEHQSAEDSELGSKDMHKKLSRFTERGIK